MMKILSLTALLALLPLSSFFYYSVCDQPIKYRIDTVDPEFNLSRDDFLSSANEASRIWNLAYGKNIFKLDPEGELSINLIYDERQSLTNQINQLENKVQSGKKSLNPEISEYKRLSLEYKQKLDKLNEKVNYWNNQGGAPLDEYHKIIQEQETLQAEANHLNALAASLNVSTDLYNLEVNKLNQTITTFNSALEQRPEEGIFKGPEQRIEIYFNINKEELIHTLAHELGHARGLTHSNNPEAIMYFRTNRSIVPSNDDFLALENICKKHTILELIQSYVQSKDLAAFILNSYKDLTFK